MCASSFCRAHTFLGAKKLRGSHRGSILADGFQTSVPGGTELSCSTRERTGVDTDPVTDRRPGSVPANQHGRRMGPTPLCTSWKPKRGSYASLPGGGGGLSEKRSIGTRKGTHGDVGPRRHLSLYLRHGQIPNESRNGVIQTCIILYVCMRAWVHMFSAFGLPEQALNL